MIPKLDEYKNRWMLTSENAIKPGLEAIKSALAKMGNPEKKLKIIHVAGTNGKGSTIAFMEELLKQHGYTTGVFSSPAIVDIHDQIRINGLPISPEELNRSFKDMKDAGLDGMLTDFELLTVAAFTSYERLQPDYVLLETGMGGRLDSTNVARPLVSVITSIALDHTAFLGSTIQEIAKEKAGIIKKDTPVVIGQLPEEALKIVKSKSNKEKSPLFIYGKQFPLVHHSTNRKMRGAHQGINAEVAIEALRLAGIKLVDPLIDMALQATELPFRFQKVYPNLFLDGAHNPAAAKVLANTIRTEFPGEKVDFIIGMLKGKDIKGTLDELLSVAKSFTFIDFPYDQAAKGDHLMEFCEFSNKRVTKLINDTIILDREPKTKTIVTGSLYLLTSLRFEMKS
ncbi:bifunctional folylpolyglutamate synthase/dihydrofolate synthase [Sporosarcina sp. CAU 1771]